MTIELNYYRDKKQDQLFFTEVVPNRFKDWVLSKSNAIRLARKFPEIQGTTIWITKIDVPF